MAHVDGPDIYDNYFLRGGNMGKPKKLTKEQEQQVIEAYKSGVKTKDICKQFNISDNTLYRLLNGQTDRHPNKRPYEVLHTAKDQSAKLKNMIKAINQADAIFNNIQSGQIINLKYKKHKGNKKHVEDSKILKLKTGRVKEKYSNYFVIVSMKNPNIRQTVTKNELICREVEVVGC